ncbi:MAG: glycosyltransferase family 9 protein [Acidobacteria bacterium]|nr:glycosyltransferase family 9 protein [Acidobacteriota bacterium]
MRDLNILLIRLRLVGDVVFTTPALRALRRRFPSARLTYLVEDGAAPVLAGNPHLNDLIIVPRRRGLRRVWDDVMLARTLRRHTYDVVIDFHGGPRSSLLAWATRAPVRIGYTIAGRSWVYTRRVERPRDLRARHSVENQFDLLGPLGITAPDPSREPLEMAPDEAVDAMVRTKLRQAGAESGCPIVLLHVSAGNRFRCWPLASFGEIIVRLAKSDGRTRFVITAGPSDRHAAEIVESEVVRRLGWNPVLGCGELSLAELRALASRASLFIGGDSGPLHIAGTTGVPIVGLYGPTLPARSAPWRDPRFTHEAIEIADLPCRPCDQRRCVPGDHRCLRWITPEIVVAASERALAAPRQAVASGARGDHEADSCRKPAPRA